MSRVKERQIFWDPPSDTDITGYEVYSDDPQNSDFLDEVDAGVVTPLATTTAPELTLSEGLLPEGNYQFAAVSKDTAGNLSDPYQHPAWQNVPLDLTAPNPPSGGGIRVL